MDVIFPYIQGGANQSKKIHLMCEKRGQKTLDFLHGFPLMSDHLQQDLDTKVSIKDELRKELILGLEARLPNALTLGFSGHRHQVLPLM